MEYIINTDGGSRGNPGPAGIGYSIRNSLGSILSEKGFYIGEVTNNVAEYQAVVEALKELKKIIPKASRGKAKIEVRMDSELIVKQLNNQYQVKEKSLFTYFITVHNFTISEFPLIKFKHVPRAENARADELVNQAIDHEISR